MNRLPLPNTMSLTSWRKLTPDALTAGSSSQLLTLLLDKTAFADEEGRQRLTAAATQDVGAMVAVADRLGADGGDLAYSWLTLAALHGDRAAAAQVAAELARRGRIERVSGRSRAGRSLDRLAAEWAEGLVTEVSRAFGEDRRRLLQGWLRTTTLAAAEPPAPQEPREAVAGEMVILPQGIPSLRNERDDRALIEAWKALTLPLPLAEGPPAHLLATVLELEFPWMGEAIAAVVEDMRLRQSLGLPGFHFRPLLLVGPPGTGKTSFARRLAELTGTGYGEISAAGSADNRLLAGTARGWGSAQPGFVLQVIRRSQVANPILLVDEIDKTRADGRNGDIRQTLLSLTEPVTARAWLDECLCSAADLSAVSWILTANDAYPLRGPLLTRLRPVTVPPPRSEHLATIVAGMARDCERRWGLRPHSLPEIPPAMLRSLRRASRNGISLRRVGRAIELILAQEAAKMRVLH